MPSDEKIFIHEFGLRWPTAEEGRILSLGNSEPVDV